MKGNITNTGYKKNSKDKNNDFNIIPSNVITMKDVEHPIFGISDYGHSQMMYPNNDYKFNGNFVTEIPLKNKTMNKAEILKIAKVKNEKDFYSKYPTEEAFMKAHKKAFKKAEMGAKLKKAQNGYEEVTINDYYPEGTGVSNPAGSGKTPVDAGGFSGALGKIGGPMGALQVGQGIANGIGMLKQEKEQKNQMKKFAALSGVVSDASAIRPEGPKRKYVRPEDNVFDPNQMAPSYGTGSNFLQMQKGGNIIRNTPHLSPKAAKQKQDYDKQQQILKKQKEDKELAERSRRPSLKNKDGSLTEYGKMRQKSKLEFEKSKLQFGGALATLGSAAGSKLFGGTGQQSGAGQIGSTIGDTIGSIIPIPGLKAVLGAAGGFIGGAIGAKNQKETANYEQEGKQNLAKAAFQQGGANIHNQYSGFMENGGYMAMGGDLKTHWGGKAEPVSYNPYLPDGGESVQFRGQSHEDGGIGMSFGNSPVEVEGGEPAVKLENGGLGEDNLVVFGNMQIPSYGASEIGDPKAKGRKFKSYVNDLNKKEATQNRLSDKGLKLINDTEVKDSFDRLSVASGQATLIGTDMKLKSIAQKKQTASAVQNAILQTAEERGLDADSLAKGKMKKAKNGISTAQNGKTLNPFLQWVKDFQTMPNEKSQSSNKSSATLNQLPPYGMGFMGSMEDNSNTEGQKITELSPLELMTLSNRRKNEIGYIPTEQSQSTSITSPTPAGASTSWEGNYPASVERYYPLGWMEEPGKGKGKTVPKDIRKRNTPSTIGKKHESPIMPQFKGQMELPELDALENLAKQQGERVYNSNTDTQESPKKKRGMDASWMDTLNAALPYLRPSNQMKLDPNQLMGEMYALSNNQLEPVQSQLYQPLLKNVSDISYQDQLNANQADFNSIKKIAGNNPAALAQLAAQKYQSNSGVLGEQFRQNQGRKEGVYNENRATLNDASLKNLGILDQQYVRQSQAKSNTKAQAHEALTSISDKILKNKLENKTLGIYENMYNYRFGPQGRAWNMNPLVDFEQMMANASPAQTDPSGKTTSTTETREKYNSRNMIDSREVRQSKKTTGKNGSIVKAYKNL